MGTSNGSLIVKERAELEAEPFFPDFELPEIDKARPKFNCTGERLFRDRPDIYKALVMLLAEPGVSVRTMCRELHVSDHTVRSVAGREQIPIATVKKQVLSNISHGLRLASERVIEMMPAASTRDALIGVGILGEKMQLLSDGVTARIDIGPRIDLHEKIRKLHEDMVAKVQEMKQAKVVEIGVAGENLPLKTLTNDGSQLNDLQVADLRGFGEERLSKLSAALSVMGGGEPPHNSRAGEAPARDTAMI